MRAAGERKQAWNTSRAVRGQVGTTQGCTGHVVQEGVISLWAESVLRCTYYDPLKLGPWVLGGVGENGVYGHFSCRRLSLGSTQGALGVPAPALPHPVGLCLWRAQLGSGMRRVLQRSQFPSLSLALISPSVKCEGSGRRRHCGWW